MKVGNTETGNSLYVPLGKEVVNKGEVDLQNLDFISSDCNPLSLLAVRDAATVYTSIRIVSNHFGRWIM